jgi:hypothetical protein
MNETEQLVWRYLLGNRQATVPEICARCGVTEEFALDMLDRISSENWREPVEGVKHDSGKARIELVPPEVVFAVAHVLTFGAVKYNDRNWELGMSWGRVFGALMRHLWAWWGGKGPTTKSFLFEDLDSETGMSHLWHAACCIAFLVAYEERGAGTDDRLYSTKKEELG